MPIINIKDNVSHICKGGRGWYMSTHRVGLARSLSRLLLQELSPPAFCSTSMWHFCSKQGCSEVAWNASQEMNEFHVTHSQIQKPNPNLPATLLVPTPTPSTSFQTHRKCTQFFKSKENEWGKHPGALAWGRRGRNWRSRQHCSQTQREETGKTRQARGGGGGELHCTLMSLHHDMMRWAKQLSLL